MEINKKRITLDSTEAIKRVTDQKWSRRRGPFQKKGPELRPEACQAGGQCVQGCICHTRDKGVSLVNAEIQIQSWHSRRGFCQRGKQPCQQGKDLGF